MFISSTWTEPGNRYSAIGLLCSFATENRLVVYVAPAIIAVFLKGIGGVLVERSEFLIIPLVLAHVWSVIVHLWELLCEMDDFDFQKQKKQLSSLVLKMVLTVYCLVVSVGLPCLWFLRGVKPSVEIVCFLSGVLAILELASRICYCSKATHGMLQIIIPYVALLMLVGMVYVIVAWRKDADSSAKMGSEVPLLVSRSIFGPFFILLGVVQWILGEPKKRDRTELGVFRCLAVCALIVSVCVLVWHYETILLGVDNVDRGFWKRGKNTSTGRDEEAEGSFSFVPPPLEPIPTNQ